MCFSGKKFEFKEASSKLTDKLLQMKLFSHCGIPFIENLHFQYKQELAVERAETILNHTSNYSGFTYLENLIKEGTNRADSFVYQKLGRDLYQKEFLPCVEYCWDEIRKSSSRLTSADIRSSECSFLEAQGFTTRPKLYIHQIFQYTLVEQYFIEKTTQFPLFFSNIIDVYEEGHIILGWKERFIKPRERLECEITTSISRSDGCLIIW